MQELPKIASSFKYIVPVATCQNKTQPYVETSYTYPNFAEWASGQRGTTNVTSGGNTVILGNQTAGALAAASTSSTATATKTSMAGMGAAAAATQFSSSAPSVQTMTSGARRSRRIFGF